MTTVGGLYYIVYLDRMGNTKQKPVIHLRRLPRLTLKLYTTHFYPKHQHYCQEIRDRIYPLTPHPLWACCGIPVDIGVKSIKKVVRGGGDYPQCNFWLLEQRPSWGQRKPGSKPLATFAKLTFFPQDLPDNPRIFPFQPRTTRRFNEIFR